MANNKQNYVILTTTPHNIWNSLERLGVKRIGSASCRNTMVYQRKKGNKYRTYYEWVYTTTNDLPHDAIFCGKNEERFLGKVKELMNE